jgi:hypothetical protein
MKKTSTNSAGVRVGFIKCSKSFLGQHQFIELIRKMASEKKTTVELKKIVNVLNDIAPLKLAEKWDNVGLLVGKSC